MGGHGAAESLGRQANCSLAFRSYKGRERRGPVLDHLRFIGVQVERAEHLAALDEPANVDPLCS